MNDINSTCRIMRIGDSEPRLDAYDKATGKTIYASDFIQKDMLWVGVKRAGVKHARLLSINTSDAIIMEGVTAVLTHEDIPGHKIHGVVRADRPVLVFEKIRYQGDPVALVVAQDEAILAEALQKITFEFESLPPVTDPQEALSPSSPLVHEDNPGGNVLLQADLKFGDPDQAPEECDVLIERVFETQVQEHAYLETEGGWARIEDDGRLVICCSTQTPFRDAYEVAQILEMDPKNVRIIAPYCGGAFGGKDSLTVQAYLGLAAIKSKGRTVKMLWDRSESFVASTKRHSAKMNYRLGAKSDGTLHFLDLSILMDTGPYDFLGGVVLTLALEHSGGPYRIPNSTIRGWLVYTNNSLGGAFRGFGVPQVTAAMEQMIDILATELGICGLELRKKNALCQGDFTFLGKKINCSTGMMQCLDTLSENPAWKNRHQWKLEAPLGTVRGYGLAAMIHGMGYGPFVKDYANAKVELTESGKIRIYSGVVDMGQGNSSTYAQIAGHILNQNAERLELIQPDTCMTLPSCSSSASRTTYTFGMALIGACEKLRDSILNCASENFGLTDSTEPVLEPGGIATRDGRHFSFQELFNAMPDERKTCVHYFEAPTASEVLTNNENLRMHGLPHEIFSFAAHAVFIEIDKLTGVLSLKKYLAVSDCGAVLNPQIYEQQVQGAIAQGIGYAMMENYSCEQSGRYPDGFADYLIPTACDVPKVDCVALDLFEPTGPFGLKGLGEISTGGPLPAVSNAVCDACGVRILSYPITAEKIYRAIKPV